MYSLHEAPSKLVKSPISIYKNCHRPGMLHLQHHQCKRRKLRGDRHNWRQGALFWSQKWEKYRGLHKCGYQKMDGL